MDKNYTARDITRPQGTLSVAVNKPKVFSTGNWEERLDLGLDDTGFCGEGEKHIPDKGGSLRGTHSEKAHACWDLHE